jgi:hypothetical protein
MVTTALFTFLVAHAHTNKTLEGHRKLQYIECTVRKDRDRCETQSTRGLCQWTDRGCVNTPPPPPPSLTCKAEPPTPHAGACEAGEKGDFCTVNCEDGYNGIGSNNWVCGKDGFWDGGTLTCTRLNCSDGSGPVPGAAECPVGADTCVGVCRAGFLPHGSHPSYTCDTTTGHWAGGDLVCERSCDIPADGKRRDAGMTGVGPACSNGTDGAPHYRQCERTEGPNYGRCECRWPWYGELCANHTDARNCTEELPDQLPCVNGGTCSFELREGMYGDEQSDYQAVCRCPDGWSGTQCAVEDPCTAHPPCQHGGQCRPSSMNARGYTCDCPEAYPEPPNCAAGAPPQTPDPDGPGDSGGGSGDDKVVLIIIVV